MQRTPFSMETPEKMKKTQGNLSGVQARRDPKVKCT